MRFSNLQATIVPALCEKGRVPDVHTRFGAVDELVDTVSDMPWPLGFTSARNRILYRVSLSHKAAEVSYRSRSVSENGLAVRFFYCTSPRGPANDETYNQPRLSFAPCRDAWERHSIPWRVYLDLA